MKIIKLTKAYGNLNAGEEAGFPNEEANEIVASGTGFLVAVEDGGTTTEPEKTSDEVPPVEPTTLPTTEPEKTKKK